MSILVLTYELNREYDDNFDYHHFYKIRDSYKPVQISDVFFRSANRRNALAGAPQTSETPASGR